MTEEEIDAAGASLAGGEIPGEGSEDVAELRSFCLKSVGFETRAAESRSRQRLEDPVLQPATNFSSFRSL